MTRLTAIHTIRNVIAPRERNTAGMGSIPPPKAALPSRRSIWKPKRAAAPIIPEIAPDAPTSGAWSYG